MPGILYHGLMAALWEPNYVESVHEWYERGEWLQASPHECLISKLKQIENGKIKPQIDTAGSIWLPCSDGDELWIAIHKNGQIEIGHAG